MTFEEAKEIFLNRGYEQVDDGSIYNPDKWRESVIVISNWLQQAPVDAVSRAQVKERMMKYGFFAPDMTVTEFVEDLPSY